MREWNPEGKSVQRMYVSGKSSPMGESFLRVSDHMESVTGEVVISGVTVRKRVYRKDEGWTDVRVRSDLERLMRSLAKDVREALC